MSAILVQSGWVEMQRESAVEPRLDLGCSAGGVREAPRQRRAARPVVLGLGLGGAAGLEWPRAVEPFRRRSVYFISDFPYKKS